VYRLLAVDLLSPMEAGRSFIFAYVCRKHAGGSDTRSPLPRSGGVGSLRIAYGGVVQHTFQKAPSLVTFQAEAHRRRLVEPSVDFAKRGRRHAVLFDGSFTSAEFLRWRVSERANEGAAAGQTRRGARTSLVTTFTEACMHTFFTTLETTCSGLIPPNPSVGTYILAWGGTHKPLAVAAHLLPSQRIPGYRSPFRTTRE
jgi:hypothetical protein